VIKTNKWNFVSETQSPKQCSPNELKPDSDKKTLVVEEDTKILPEKTKDQQPVSEPVNTPDKPGTPPVESVNGSSCPDPADADSEENDKENVKNHQESSSEAILDPLNNVDEMLRRMDEIDPGHKLRSLCKKGDAAALTEFLKEDVDLV
jgi:hypothetical protein